MMVVMWVTKMVVFILGTHYGAKKRQWGPCGCLGSEMPMSPYSQSSVLLLSQVLEGERE